MKTISRVFLSILLISCGSQTDKTESASDLKTLAGVFKRYVVMQEETQKYWAGSPDKEWILNIAGRSSEFNAINQMLNNGGKLEDVVVSESYMMR